MNPEEIAKKITSDPDIFNEGWEELGIENPNVEELRQEMPGMNWLIVFSPKNFGSREEAISYAQHCFGVDLSDGKQHEIILKGCRIAVELQFNKDI